MSHFPEVVWVVVFLGPQRQEAGASAPPHGRLMSGSSSCWPPCLLQGSALLSGRSEALSLRSLRAPPSASCHRESATPQLRFWLGPHPLTSREFTPLRGGGQIPGSSSNGGTVDFTQKPRRLLELAGTCHPGGAPWSGPPEAEGQPSTVCGDRRRVPSGTKTFPSAGAGGKAAGGDASGTEGDQKAGVPGDN